MGFVLMASSLTIGAALLIWAALIWFGSCGASRTSAPAPVSAGSKQRQQQIVIAQAVEQT
jgi:hypothetical protein